MEKRLACVDDIKQNVNNLTTEKLNKYIHVQMATVWQPPETQKLHNFLLLLRPVPWLAALMPFVKMTLQFPCWTYMSLCWSSWWLLSKFLRKTVFTCFSAYTHVFCGFVQFSMKNLELFFCVRWSFKKLSLNIRNLDRYRMFMSLTGVWEGTVCVHVCSV